MTMVTRAFLPSLHLSNLKEATNAYKEVCSQLPIFCSSAPLLELDHEILLTQGVPRCKVEVSCVCVCVWGEAPDENAWSGIAQKQKRQQKMTYCRLNSARSVLKLRSLIALAHWKNLTIFLGLKGFQSSYVAILIWAHQQQLAAKFGENEPFYGCQLSWPWTN